MHNKANTIRLLLFYHAPYSPHHIDPSSTHICVLTENALSSRRREKYKPDL